MRLKLFLAIFLSAGLFLEGSGQSVLPSFGGSRVGTTGFQFLKVWPDARSAGMGGAVHADVHDVSALYWNPAGITRIEDSLKYNFQVGYTGYFAGVNLSYAGAVWRKSPYRAWGLQVLSLNSGNMPVTTEYQPGGTGQTYSVNSSIIGLTYAQVLTDQFSFGLSGKYSREGISGVVTNNVLFDFGFQYNVGWKDLKFSVGINNFGVNVTPDGKLKRLNMTGVKEVSNYESVSVPATFRVGLAKKWTINPDNIINTAIQLNHPTDNAETFGLGVEYAIHNLIFVRTGYEIGRGDNQIPSFGFGVKAPRSFGRIRVDYGYQNRQYLGDVHRITLAIGLK